MSSAIDCAPMKLAFGGGRGRGKAAHISQVLLGEVQQSTSQQSGAGIMAVAATQEPWTHSSQHQRSAALRHRLGEEVSFALVVVGRGCSGIRRLLMVLAGKTGAEWLAQMHPQQLEYGGAGARGRTSGKGEIRPPLMPPHLAAFWRTGPRQGPAWFVVCEWAQRFRLDSLSVTYLWRSREKCA